jgi:hypothetical protein
MPVVRGVYNTNGCETLEPFNMIADLDIAPKAKKIYETQLRAKLEATNRDDFVAIEPLSGDHFVARTFVEAALAAKSAHPDREPFVIRIGHAAAIHIGAS